MAKKITKDMLQMAAEVTKRKANRWKGANDLVKTLKGSNESMSFQAGKVKAGAKGLRVAKETGKVLRSGIRNNRRIRQTEEKEATKRTQAITGAQKEAALASIARWNGVIDQQPSNPLTKNDYGITGGATTGTSNEGSQLGG